MMTFGSVKNGGGKLDYRVDPGRDRGCRTSQADAGGLSRFNHQRSGCECLSISSFTYLLIPLKGTNQTNRTVLKDLLSWILKSGEGQASALSYAPLPQSLVDKELKTVYSVQ